MARCVPGLVLPAPPLGSRRPLHRDRHEGGFHEDGFGPPCATCRSGETSRGNRQTRPLAVWPSQFCVVEVSRRRCRWRARRFGRSVGRRRAEPDETAHGRHPLASRPACSSAKEFACGNSLRTTSQLPRTSSTSVAITAATKNSPPRRHSRASTVG
jgi:hypothetical protein